MEGGLIARFERDLESLAVEAFCPDPYELLDDQRSLLLPPDKISTTECASRFRYLRNKEGGGKRLWSPDLTPYVAAIQDALDDKVHRFVAVAGPGRSGKSVAGENHIFRRMRNGPLTDVIIYLQASSDCDSYADKEFRDFFDLHDEIKAKIGPKPEDNKRKFKRVSDRAIQLLPANMGNIRQKEATFIWASEIDGYRASVRDGFKDNIATRMQTSGHQAKGYIESHPDCGWTSGIAPIWQDSTRGVWYWPCTSCGGWSSTNPLADKEFHMTLNVERPEGLSDDELLDHVEKHAALVCPHCGTLLGESDRTEMLAGGRWVFAGETIDAKGNVAGEPRDSDTAGFWIHGTMSPFIGLGELVRKYVAAVVFFEKTRKPERLKEVVVKTLGEVYEGAGDKRPVDPKALMARDRTFAAKTVPEEVKFITAAVDIGGAKFDVLLTGWDLEGRSWLIDRFTIVQNGDRRVSPAERIEDWMVLKTLVLDRLTPIVGDDGEETGLALPVAAMACDLHGNPGVTPNAREFARRMALLGVAWGKGSRAWQKVRLVRGGSSKNAPEVPPSGRKVSVDDQGNKIEPTVLEWTLNVDKLRWKTMERLAAEDGSPGCVEFGDGLPRAAFEELAGEVWLDNKWVRRGANETLDCYDAETEVLTDQGWRKFATLDRTEKMATVNLDSQEIEYQRPTDYIVRRHEGEMISIQGRRIDILVTPNHRMVTFRKKFLSPQRKFTFDVPPKITMAKDLDIHHQLMVAADWKGSRRRIISVPEFVNSRGRLIASKVSVDAGDWAEFLGWYVSEGCATIHVSRTQGNKRHRITLCQNDGVKGDRIHDLLGRLPWRFAEHRRGRLLVWTSTSKQLFMAIAECGRRSSTKRVPEWIRWADAGTISRFLDAAVDGDGWTQRRPGQRPHRTYSTISKELADGVQELFIKIGCASNIKVHEPVPCSIGSPNGTTKPQYHVSECKRRKASLDGGAGGQRKFIGERVSYNGMVYCVTVPNGTLVCRRNGRSFIAGNCFGYCEAARIMLKPERKDIKWDADDKGPAKLPPWAKPVAMAGAALPETRPVAPRKSIYAQFDALNSNDQET